MTIDNTINIEVPEGIDLQTELAGPTVRALAYAFDMMIRCLIMAAVSLVMAFFGDMGAGFLLISLFTLEWFYPVLFEVLSNGQTPGKKKFNIQVINNDMTPVRWEASTIRNLLRGVDFLPFANMLGLICMLCGREFKRLGDLAAGTVVVYKKERSKHSLPDVDSQYLSQPVSLDEQLAIINFTYRHKQLSKARQEELAELASDLHSQQGEAAVKSIQGLGLGLLGKQ
jgi:uncharacterized RDD family membrane protein YckC